MSRHGVRRNHGSLKNSHPTHPRKPSLRALKRRCRRQITPASCMRIIKRTNNSNARRSFLPLLVLRCIRTLMQASSRITRQHRISAWYGPDSGTTLTTPCITSAFPLRQIWLCLDVYTSRCDSVSDYNRWFVSSFALVFLIQVN